MDIMRGLMVSVHQSYKLEFLVKRIETNVSVKPNVRLLWSHLVVVPRLDAHWDLTLNKQTNIKKQFRLKRKIHWKVINSSWIIYIHTRKRQTDKLMCIKHQSESRPMLKCLPALFCSWLVLLKISNLPHKKNLWVLFCVSSCELVLVWLTSDLWAGLHMAVFDGTVSVVGPEGTRSLQVHLDTRQKEEKVCESPSFSTSFSKFSETDSSIFVGVSSLTSFEQQATSLFHLIVFL